ncbi:MAG: hypothetical protein WCB50_09500, partial [Pseudolabrys sp.]
PIGKLAIRIPKPSTHHTLGVRLNSFVVAGMLHGVAGSDWESLKRKENCCDKLQHGGRWALKLSH